MARKNKNNGSSAFKAWISKLIRRWAWPGMILALIAALGGWMWWNGEEIAKKPFVSPILEAVRAAFGAVPEPVAGRFNVAIANLVDDPDAQTRHQLTAELQNFATRFNELGSRELRAVAVRAVPLRIPLANETGRAAIQAGHREARAFLEKYGYDVLLWGRVTNPKDPVPHLYWTTLGILAHDDPYKLPAVTTSDLSVVLRARIATHSQEEHRGHSVAAHIRPFVDQLRVLIDTGGSKPGWDVKALYEIQGALANSLLTLGEQPGEIEPLRDATLIYRRLLDSPVSRSEPLDWAQTQDNLGAALMLLGQRESGTASLEAAVGAFREALKERTREKVPLDWAATQHDLGVALMALGARESGTARLEEAVAAFRETLTERTREKIPRGWAATQDGLGGALMALGARESGTASLDEAVEAYREALKERTREKVPLGWAETQNNLGTALATLGQRESDAARLEQAVRAYREALKERTREKAPLDWAATQYNLGLALATLGARDSGTARLER